MKVGGNKDDVSTVEVLRLLERKRSGEIPQRGETAAGSAAPKESDQVAVQLGLSRNVGKEFDVAAMVAERQARFEKLKQAVQGGTYVFPSSDAVAQKLAEEINIEILSGGKFSDE